MTKLAVILPGILVISIIPFAFAEYDTLVLMETNSGNFVIELFPDVAPKHVENFIHLSSSELTGMNANMYKDTFFHRIIPGFMIQGGDPNTRFLPDDDSVFGQGSLGYFVEAEFNDIKHERGIVSMARSMDPNSAGTQFFIVHKDSTFLDGQYTVFGRLVTQESFETLDKIALLQTGQRDIPIDRDAAKITKTQLVSRADVNNLLELDPPARAYGTAPTTTQENSEYVDEDLGFSFLPPNGWQVTKPTVNAIDESTGKPVTPAVAVIGPQNSDDIPPTFTVKVENSMETLDDHVRFLKGTIQWDTTTIATEGNLQHNGLDGYLIVVDQIFENTDGETIPLKIRAFLIKSPDKLYTLQFANSEAHFSKTEKQFSDILDSFTITGTSPTQTTPETPSEGGGCLIATAAYGSEMAPQVQFLREIRDNTVLQTQSGTSFMTAFNTFYYTFSPTVADYERENPVFKEAVKVGLTPLLTSLTILNYVDIDTEQEMLGYGIGIIMLNIGMYFVAPAVVIIALKKRRR